MIDLQIRDENSPLRSVVVGLGTDPGPVPTLGQAYDAKTYHTLIEGTYPTDEALEREVEHFAQVLAEEGIEVYRPKSIKGVNQIFARDVAFVIEDTMIRANIIEDRAPELAAYDDIFARIPTDKMVVPPDHVHVEGGDVVILGDKILVGMYMRPDFETYSMARTNKYAIGFLKDLFPHKDIIPLGLIKHDTDPYKGVLHLDCAFQPVGGDKAILFPGAFRHVEDWEYIFNLFGAENTCVITREEMFEMNPNIFICHLLRW